MYRIISLALNSRDRQGFSVASLVSLKEVWYYWCLGAKSAQKELRDCSVVRPLEKSVPSG